MCSWAEGLTFINIKLILSISKSSIKPYFTHWIFKQRDYSSTCYTAGRWNAATLSSPVQCIAARLPKWFNKTLFRRNLQLRHLISPIIVSNSTSQESLNPRNLLLISPHTPCHTSSSSPRRTPPLFHFVKFNLFFLQISLIRCKACSENKSFVVVIINIALVIWVSARWLAAWPNGAEMFHFVFGCFHVRYALSSGRTVHFKSRLWTVNRSSPRRPPHKQTPCLGEKRKRCRNRK